MSLKRLIGTCAVAVGAVTVGAPVAAADGVGAHPFQVNPAPFGNPNGSFDHPPVDCVTVVGEQPSEVRISGGGEGGWGCLLYSRIDWVNLSTGETGVGWMSDGLHGNPPESTLVTGPGHVALALWPTNPTVTPGFTTVTAQ